MLENQLCNDPAFIHLKSCALADDVGTEYIAIIAIQSVDRVFTMCFIDSTFKSYEYVLYVYDVRDRYISNHILKPQKTFRGSRNV